MLIVLEGIDGSGKTTVAQRLAAHLREAGREVVETREPWTSEAGQELRRLLAAATRTSTAEEEWALFHADRREHVAQVVRPARERGAWVVQDRTFYSTAAYQGARGMDVDAILKASREVAPEPDLVLLLSISPEQALERIRRGRDAFSSFERREALEAVDAIYRDLVTRAPKMIEVNAQRSLEEVMEEVIERVQGRAAEQGS